MREKLIELIEQEYYCSIEEIADHLIANGVTIDKDINVPSKWIPVSEPPKESGMYNVTVEKLYGITYSDVAYFDALSKKWGTNTHHYSCDKVTHWMPLPKPHKET